MKLCKKLHQYEGSMCSLCHKLRCEAYAKANPDKVKGIKRAYYERNKDKVIAASKLWQKTYPEKANLKTRKYAKSNPEKVRARIKDWKTRNVDRTNASRARRLAEKLKATPSWLTREHLKECSRFYSEARRLRKLDGVSRHVDHIIPLQGKTVCGLHVPWNLQILTKAENLSKGNRYET